MSQIVRTEYEIENGKPVIYAFSRNNEGKRILEKITNFKPYFYIQDNVELRDTRIEKIEQGNYYSIDGKKLKKVYAYIPKDVAVLREKVPMSWEADVVFPTRYMIDLPDNLEPTKIRKMYLDIEVDSSKKFPSVEEAQNEIVCMSIYDNLSDLYISFTQRQDISLGVHSTLFDERLHEIRYYRSETDMIKGFIEQMRLSDPDIITGWNLIRFDLTYLINRMNVLRMNPNQLSPMGRTYIRDFGVEKEKKYLRRADDSVVIKGISIIDLYDVYIHNTYSAEVSYQLDYIGKKVVGIGKTSTANSVRYLWKMKLEELITYNVNDVRITRAIDEKMGLIDFVDELRRIGYCQHEDVMTASRISDSYILRLFHNKKIFPSKSSHERPEYEGALVDSWAVGVYSNVVMLDVKSLYPSTIVSFNLSPETFDPNGDIHVNNLRLSSTKKGFLPEVIETLFKERARYKKLRRECEFDTPEYLMYDLRQKAVKILLNALYGQTAYPHSRIHDARIADTITYVGRQLITWSKEYVKELGCVPLYIDTDGVAVQVSAQLNPETVRMLLNDSYTQFCAQYGVTKHIFEMEIKKIYRRAFFGQSKKRYAGHVIIEDDKTVDYLEVVGFEVRRSDSSEFSRKMQSTIFDMLLRQDKGKEEVIQYLGHEVDRIRKGDFTLSEIGIPKGITKDLGDYDRPSGNIRGALYTVDVLGHELSNKPKMVYIKALPAGLPTEHQGKTVDTICFDEDAQVPAGTQVDVEKMLSKIVKDKIEAIFEALGWKMNELSYHWKGKAKKGGEQLSMGIE